MNDRNKSIIYNATETAALFHLDDNSVRGLLGGVGTGKSTACCMEIIRRAKQQEAGHDGIRYSRWCIIRNTYPELKSTTIKTWQMWFPAKAFGAIKWSSPISHHLKFDDVDCEVIFLALDGPADVGKLASLELTGIYINEMQFIPKAVFDICLQRVNRFPPKWMGAGLSWTGVIWDSNPPDNDHWIYKLFEINKPSEYSLYKYQPALVKIDPSTTTVIYKISLDGTAWARNESLDYQYNQRDYEYWLKLVPGYVDEQIKIFLNGEYGVIRINKPIYPQYNDNLHAVDSLSVNPAHSLRLGWDFGLTPACLITQYIDGQLRVIKEFVSDNCMLEDLIVQVVKPWLNIHAPNIAYQSDCDPADNDLLHHKETLDKHGINTDYGITNQLSPRLDAVKKLLSGLTYGKPSIIISKDGCPVLRAGFIKDYYFKRVNIYGEQAFKEEPFKSHPVSDIHDSLQYIALRLLEDTLTPSPHSLAISFVDNRRYI